MINYSLIFVTIVLSVAATTDMICLKVPNKLTFPAMALGLLLCRFPFTSESRLRLLWCIVFFIIGYFRIMGMGDLKLCMSVICLRGIGETWKMMLFAACAMFFYCLVSEPNQTKLYVKSLFRSFVYHTKPISDSDSVYPFALFLAIGYGFNFIIS